MGVQKEIGGGQRRETGERLLRGAEEENKGGKSSRGVRRGEERLL